MNLSVLGGYAFPEIITELHHGELWTTISICDNLSENQGARFSFSRFREVTFGTTPADRSNAAPRVAMGEY